MTAKKLATITLIVILCVVALVTQQVSQAGPSFPNTPQAVEQAKSLVNFPVRAATKLPFNSDRSFAFVKEVTPDVISMDIDYVSPEGDSIRVTTNNAPVTPVSDQYELKQVSLSKGRQATFMDNGTAQILNWNEGDLSYQVAGIKRSSSYTLEELVAVAEALQQK